MRDSVGGKLLPGSVAALGDVGDMIPSYNRTAPSSRIAMQLV